MLLKKFKKTFSNRKAIGMFDAVLAIPFVFGFIFFLLVMCSAVEYVDVQMEVTRILNNTVDTMAYEADITQPAQKRTQEQLNNLRATTGDYTLTYILYTYKNGSFNREVLGVGTNKNIILKREIPKGGTLRILYESKNSTTLGKLLATVRKGSSSKIVRASEAFIN